MRLVFSSNNTNVLAWGKNGGIEKGHGLMTAIGVPATAGRRIAAVSIAGLAAIGAAFFGTPVSAQAIEVPIQDVMTNGEPGSSVALGSADVSDDLQGRSCEVAAVVTNQSSEHAGNVLVISSGDSSITVASIEDQANTVTSGSGTLTLGSTVEVAVVLGDTGGTSLGSSLTVTCAPLPPTPPPPAVEGEPPYTG